MSQAVHRIWRYTPQLIEEAMAYEDGQLWPDQIGDTWPLPEAGDGVEYECECGEEFESKAEAKQHLEEVIR